jgi:hypothetical protein
MPLDRLWRVRRTIESRSFPEAYRTFDCSRLSKREPNMSANDAEMAAEG